MRNYVAVVFGSSAKAYQGLHAFWEMDTEGVVTVHGSAVVHRGLLGHLHVDTKETQPGLATAVGIGVGAVLGMFAGPGGMLVGAATGAGLGAIADLGRADTGQQALDETAFVLPAGHAAVLVDVSEDDYEPVNARMRAIGGTLYRREKSAVRNDSRWESNYFYPYEYVPENRGKYW